MNKKARFEAGKPADPCQNMSKEDCDKWNNMNEEYGDKFKTANNVQALIKLAVGDIPADVERYVKETKEGNPDYTDEQAWATAWSRYCKYKNPGSEHCHMNTSDYFPGRAASDLGKLQKLAFKKDPMNEPASLLPGDEKSAMFEKGKNADPCENMSEADCAEWKKQNEEHKDEFKAASTTKTAGYSHFWKLLPRDDGQYGFTPAEWSKLIAETKKIILKAKNSEVLVAGGSGKGSPKLDRNMILLNGADPDSYETFMLTRVPENLDSYTFCKTAQLPYDAVVVSILAAARKIAPLAIEVDSDGGESAIKRVFAMDESMTGLAKLATWEEGERDDDDPRDHEGEGSLTPGMEEKRATLEESWGEVLGRFEEGKSADPTKNMSPEDAAEWKKQNELHKDEFKAANAFPKDEGVRARFEEGKPADPTKNMNPEDAAEWKKQNELHKDQFKSAASASELKEMQELLKAKGYDPKDAKKLQSEGLGTFELESLLKEKGGLERTHGLKKTAAKGSLVGSEGFMSPEGSLLITKDHALAWRRMGPSKMTWTRQVPSSSSPDGWKPGESRANFLNLTKVMRNEGEMILVLPSPDKTAAYGDPYWTTAKYPGRAQDGTPIKRGDKVFYYPRTKTMMVGQEALEASKEFASAAADEDGYRAASPKVQRYDQDSMEQAFKQAFIQGKGLDADVDLGLRVKSYSVGMATPEGYHLEGADLDVIMTPKTAAKAPTGLYGYTKAVQSDCEGCIRKLSRTASGIAKRVYSKDAKVAEFLSKHATQGESLPAKILVAAMRDLGPKIASTKLARLEELRDLRKEASSTDKEAGRKYGLYGFLAKTANLGLTACTELRENAGQFAASLHGRRADRYEHITGFFDNHAKTANCLHSQLIRSSYPGADMRCASVTLPSSVDEWLAWEE